MEDLVQKYRMLKMELLSSFLKDSSEAEMELLDIHFDPPFPATLQSGDTITATIEYASEIKGQYIQAWVYGDDGLDGRYDPSGYEPANGEIERSFIIMEEGHLSKVCINMQHFDGTELLAMHINVDYTITANPNWDEHNIDGQGSKAKIARVMVDDMVISKGGRVPVGTEIEIGVSYRNTTEQGASLWVFPDTQTEVPGAYAPGGLPNKEQGKVIKWVTLNAPCQLNGFHLKMVNSANQTIAEEWLEFPLTIA